MSYQKRYAPDRVEEAGRDAVRGDRGGAVSREEGAMARASALLAPIRLDSRDEARAARLVRRHGHAGGWDAERVLDVLGIGGVS